MCAIVYKRDRERDGEERQRGTPSFLRTITLTINGQKVLLTITLAVKSSHLSFPPIPARVFQEGVRPSPRRSFGFPFCRMRRGGAGMGLELPPYANPSPALAQGCQFECVGCDPFVPLEEKCAAGKNSIFKSFFFFFFNVHIRADDKGAVSLGGTKE